MFFIPPNISDKAAVELCEFFQDLVMSLESHYHHQLRRYAKKIEKKAELPFNKPIEFDDEIPF